MHLLPLIFIFPTLQTPSPYRIRLAPSILDWNSEAKQGRMGVWKIMGWKKESSSFFSTVYVSLGLTISYFSSSYSISIFSGSSFPSEAVICLRSMLSSICCPVYIFWVWSIFIWFVVFGLLDSCLAVKRLLFVLSERTIVWLICFFSGGCPGVLPRW